MRDDSSLPPAEAAKYLGIWPKKLRTLGLPNVGTETRKRYRVTDLDEWLEANGTESDRRAAKCSSQFTEYRRWIDEHGLSRPASAHPLWPIWKGIRNRTANVEDPDYGGRGIKMHPEWQDDPVAFYEWVEQHLGLRPTYVTRDGKVRGQSIDRIDNDGSYAPGNIRWADAGQQNGNRRSWAKHDDVDVICLCIDGPHRKDDPACSERELFELLRRETTL